MREWLFITVALVFGVAAYFLYCIYVWCFAAAYEFAGDVVEVTCWYGWASIAKALFVYAGPSIVKLVTGQAEPLPISPLPPPSDSPWWADPGIVVTGFLGVMAICKKCFGG